MLRAYMRSDLSGLNKLEAQLPSRLESTVREGAEMVVRDIRASWSPNSPSPVGQPPAVVTGDLDASIQAKPSKRTGGGQFAREGVYYVIEAGARHRGTYYAPLLENTEYAPPSSYDRPFLTPAMERIAPQYFDMFKVLLRAR